MAKKALIITSNAGVEHDELIKPLEFLKSKGIEAIHAAEKNEEVQTMKGDKEPGSVYTPDSTFEKVDPADYDILIVPGGTVNADTLRINEQVQQLIQHFTDNGKPIAMICHAPWTLINAGRIEGKTVTGYQSLELDLKNAGGLWKDEAVAYCKAHGWILITSRNPGDLPEFNEAILKELEAA